MYEDWYKHLCMKICRISFLVEDEGIIVYEGLWKRFLVEDEGTFVSRDLFMNICGRRDFVEDSVKISMMIFVWKFVYVDLW